MLSEFGDRYCICDTTAEFIAKWLTYTAAKEPDFLKAYDAVYAKYNPLENYSRHENSYETIDHGDITHSHEPDSEHHTTTTTNDYNYFTENTDDSTDKPTTTHYISTFDAGTRVESEDVTQGKTTTHVYTDKGDSGTDNKNITTVSDDNAYTDTETHTTVSKTIGGETVTADDIKQKVSEISGLNRKSNQELIKEQFEIAEYSLIYMYIYEFINRYTYYVGDGEFYDLNIL